jgi:hypothetical protein
MLCLCGFKLSVFMNVFNRLIFLDFKAQPLF